MKRSGGDHLDCEQDRVFSGDPAQVERRTERDTGQRPGVTTDEQARVKALEREVRELRRANELLRKASAYFAQAELDRR